MIGSLRIDFGVDVASKTVLAFDYRNHLPKMARAMSQRERRLRRAAERADSTLSVIHSKATEEWAYA
jgi:hypothetical protein